MHDKSPSLRGNAPDISHNEMLGLRGQTCAVEFGTRTLLGSGTSRAKAIENAFERGFGDLQMYTFSVPRNFIRQTDLPHSKD